MKAIPTTSNIDTLPILTKEIIDEISTSTDHPDTRHASSEGPAFVLVFVRGGWYKAPFDELTALGKLTKKIEYPYGDDGELKNLGGDDDTDDTDATS
jgi:hypothetical protein